MSPSEAAAFVGSIVETAAKTPAAIEKIDQWIKGAAERPDAELAALPDFTRLHLEAAALERRAAGG